MTDFFFNNIRLPSKDELLQKSKKSLEVLKNEDSLYRPLNIEGNPGGLLDFFSDSLPVIVIPDLHARPYFLKNILEYKILPEINFVKSDKEETVFSALENKLLRVVFLGDALHSEKTTVERWKSALADFENDIYDGDFMKEEMKYGLSLLMDLMELKIKFPSHFHFLKGNHENIKNERSGGDFPFRKYADEGNMVKSFMEQVYGKETLDTIFQFEKNLPLLYASSSCFVSHAEPAFCFSREEIINSVLFSEVVTGLTWTDNGDAVQNSVIETISEISPVKFTENPVWISGHRPVQENYKSKYKGAFIQIHNPLKQNIVMVSENKKFNPESDIVGVEK